MINLTEREKEILKMLCLPTKIIAERLFISEITVKTHIVHLYNKIYVPFNSRTLLLAEGLKKQIIKLEEIITE